MAEFEEFDDIILEAIFADEDGKKTENFNLTFFRVALGQCSVPNSAVLLHECTNSRRKTVSRKTLRVCPNE